MHSLTIENLVRVWHPCGNRQLKSYKKKDCVSLWVSQTKSSKALSRNLLHREGPIHIWKSFLKIKLLKCIFKLKLYIDYEDPWCFTEKATVEEASCFLHTSFQCSWLQLMSVSKHPILSQHSIVSKSIFHFPHSTCKTNSKI